MRMGETISVPWPPAPLPEIGWRSRLEDLASSAESFIGKDCSLQDTATLALELIGLLWPVIGAPETVAGSCRASLLVGPPGVILAAAPADQLAEIADRLDQIWLQAQQHPAAGVVELGAPLLHQIVAPRKPRTPRRPNPEALEPDGDELPAAWLDSGDAPQHEPSRTPPPGWWPVADLAELLEVTRSTVCRRRSAGEMGARGSGWVKCGKSYYFSPESVAAAEAGESVQQLSALVAEIQAEP